MRDQALDRVRAWSEKRLIDRSWRSQDWTTASCRLIYLPFWMLTAHVVGSVKGYRIESDETSDTEVPMDRTLDNDFIWTGTACRSGDIGVWCLSTLFRETQPLATDIEGMAEATVPRADAFSECMRALPGAVLEYCGVPYITAHEIQIQEPEGTLVLYPFWMIGAASADPTYFALVDGVTGGLVSARAPGDYLRRMGSLLAAMALSVLGVTIFISVLLYFASNANRFSSTAFQACALLTGMFLIFGFSFCPGSLCL
ncbi:MAG: hypothetical protein PHP59_07970 [Methanofollis sp.]|uniref:hypothetical protein n=1 Tax=Methanofollis sp. TaxID=2052835 RepID=UPI0026162DC7|nr:hypothetical protein [Methanofollis sp.]MDD4255296.1 hypothetical protein [Methanofollis sp.]